jgi:hypothetical protein
MYVNNWTLPRPPDDLLAKCHEVLIGDPAFVMWRMKKFCRESDLSLVWSELVEVADHSYTYDQIAAFYFIDEQDAIIFSLKYK